MLHKLAWNLYHRVERHVPEYDARDSIFNDSGDGCQNKVIWSECRDACAEQYFISRNETKYTCYGIVTRHF